MPLGDWISKYPQVQALLQAPEEVLEYAPDGERGEPLRIDGCETVSGNVVVEVHGTPVQVTYPDGPRGPWRMTWVEEGGEALMMRRGDRGWRVLHTVVLGSIVLAVAAVLVLVLRFAPPSGSPHGIPPRASVEMPAQDAVVPPCEDAPAQAVYYVPWNGQYACGPAQATLHPGECFYWAGEGRLGVVRCEMLEPVAVGFGTLREGQE